MILQLFAVERYDDSGGVRPLEPFPVLPAEAKLVCAVYLPADDVVLALVEGRDERSVFAAVTAAGWRVDRITMASWATPPIDSEIYSRPVPATGGSRDGTVIPLTSRAYRAAYA